MVKGIVDMVIDENLDERIKEHLRTLQREDPIPFTCEETRYLDLVKGTVSLFSDLYTFLTRPSLILGNTFLFLQ